MNQQLHEWFNWWKCQDTDIMEIRFLPSPACKTETEIISKVREIGNKIGIPNFGNSFFITKCEDLIKILTTHDNFFRKLNVYYGINPRRRLVRYSKKYKKTYDSFGKGYAGVSSINFLAFDIESVNRKGAATQEQLRDAFLTTNDLQEYLRDKYGWENCYKACSGGGYHLVYKLDKPIKIPEFSYVFDEVKQDIHYNIHENEEFNEIKKCVNNFLEKVSERTEAHYKCKVDRVGDAPRILRLPFTINWKGEPRKSEILEFKYDVINHGLTDRLLEFKAKKSQIILSKKKERKLRTIQELRQEPLTKLLLTKGLPQGMRNHYLEFQFAFLLRDNAFDINSDEVKKLIKEIEIAQGNPISVDPRYLSPYDYFNSAVVNSWCEKNLYPPAYELLPNRLPIRTFRLPKFETRKSIDIYRDMSFQQIIIQFCEKIISHSGPNSYTRVSLLQDLNGALIARFGNEKAEYYWKYYVREWLEKWSF